MKPPVFSYRDMFKISQTALLSVVGFIPLDSGCNIVRIPDRLMTTCSPPVLFDRHLCDVMTVLDNGAKVPAFEALKIEAVDNGNYKKTYRLNKRPEITLDLYGKDRNHDGVIAYDEMYMQALTRPAASQIPGRPQQMLKATLDNINDIIYFSSESQEDVVLPDGANLFKDYVDMIVCPEKFSQRRVLRHCQRS